MSEIISVRYNIEDNSSIEITFDDASKANQPHNNGVRYQYTDQLNEWLDVPNAIEPYDQYYGMSLEAVKEINQDQVDSDCRGYIHSYWSPEAQSNVAMGLYEQSLCELCKTEVSDVLTQNTGFIEDIAALGSNQAIDDYVDNITRVTITGGQ